MRNKKLFILISIISLCLIGGEFALLKKSLSEQKKVTTQITTDKHFIYKDDVAQKGFYASWHVPPKDNLSDEEIRQTLTDIKEFGFKGIGFEIPWSDVEPEDDKFIFPKRYDRVLEIADELELNTHMLFAAQYTPQWLYSKYEQDIKMKNYKGESVDGSYLTFSPFSPAIKDVADFQINAINYYLNKHSNIIAVFLTNENAYGDQHQTQWLDYSHWAEIAWEKYLRENDLPYKEIPISTSQEYWNHFLDFRIKGLSHYFNYLYSVVKSSLERDIPVSHKLIFYETTATFTDKVGLHPVPNDILVDIVGTDLYSKIPNAFTLQNAFEKPVMLVETNIRGITTTAQEMFNFLIYEWFQNPGVITIYRWNGANNDENTLWRIDGTPYPKTHGAKKLIALQNKVRAKNEAKKTKFSPQQNDFAILLPQNFMARYGFRHWDIQYILDDLSNIIDTTPYKAKAIWSSEIEEVSLQGLKFIVALSDREKGTDNHMYESTKIAKWVRDGGHYFLDSRFGNLPKWIDGSQKIQDSKNGEISFGNGKIIYSDKAILNKLDKKRVADKFRSYLREKADMGQFSDTIISLSDGINRLLQAKKDAQIQLSLYNKDYTELIFIDQTLQEFDLTEKLQKGETVVLKKRENLIFIP